MMRKILFLFFLLGFFFNSSHAFLGDAFVKNTLTINSSQVVSDEVDFVALINETNINSSIWDYCGNGSDIYFSDSTDTTYLEREVVFWNNSTNQTEIWVKVPSISSVSDVEINFYCGGSEFFVNNLTVWDGYNLVNHLDDFPSVDDSHDSTSNAFNGTFQAGMTDADVVLGSLGNETDFDGGATDYISFSDEAKWDVINNFTMSVKVNVSTSGALEPMIGRWGSGAADQAWIFTLNTINQPTFFVDAGSVSATSALTIGQEAWVYYNYLSNGTYLFYIDKVMSGTGTQSAATDETAEVWIGAYERGTFFNGRLDEVRIHNGSLSEGRIQTEVNNQKDPDTFISFDQLIFEEAWTVNETFNSSYFELSDQQLLISIRIFNITGDIKNLTITNLTFDSVDENLTLYEPSGIWRNGTFNISNDLLNAGNNTIKPFNWTYLVEWVNGTNLTIITDTINQSVFHIVYISNVTALNVLEGEDFRINSSVFDNTSLVSKQVVIEYNKTNYSTFSTIANEFFNLFTADVVGVDTNVNYTSWMNVTYNNSTVTRSFPYQDQIVFNLVISTGCGGVNVTHNFTFFDEINNSLIGADSSFFFNVTSLNYTAGFNWTNLTYVEVCMKPYDASFLAHMDMEYTAEDFEIRHYYLRNNTFSNDTQDFSIFLINETSGEELSVTIFDAGGSLVSDAVVIAEKNPFLNTTYSRVDMGITAVNGKTSLFLEVDRYYNFIVLYQGVTFDLGQIKIGSAEITNGISLNLNPSLSIPFLNIYNNVAVDYTNVSSPTNQTVIQVVTLDGSTVTGNLNVVQKNGTISITLCDNSTSSNAFIMTCSLGELAGVYTIKFNIDVDGGKVSVISDVLDYGQFIDFGADILWVIVVFVTVLTFVFGGFPHLMINSPQLLLWTLKWVRIINIDRIYLIGFTLLSLLISYLFNMIKDGDQ